jgi:hypothetical protein
MGTTIATLAVKLIGEATDFVRTMNESESKTKTWSANVSKNIKDVGGNITNFGKGATSYLTLPLIAAGGAAIKYASDLEETKNKVNVVFGDMANSVMAWSQTSDTAMGLSQQKALDSVGVFGAMGQSAGLNAKENLKWSQSLVQLGSDWSSFYNLSPVDSLNAIQSAVAGQYEPLRRMGIVINQASLEQKALQMGLLEEGGILTDAARYQALYALMVEKSAAAQGDFARTADGAANQGRIVQAQFENAAAILGQQLLPYWTQLLVGVSQAITWFQQLTPEQQKWTVGILAVTAVIGPLLIVIGSLVTAIGAIVGVLGAITAPIWITIGVIAALIAIGYLLYLGWTNNWGGIQERTATAIAFIRGLIESGMQFISDFTSGKMGWVSQMWSNTFNMIMLVVQTWITNVKLIFAAFQAAFNGDWHRFGELLRQVWNNTWTMMGAILSTAWANIKIGVSGLITSVVDFFRNTNWGQVGTNIVKGIANGITSSLSFIVDAARRAAQAALEAAQGFLGIHSPSTKAHKVVGMPIGQGQGLGWIDGLMGMVPRIQKTLTGVMDAAMPSGDLFGSASMPGIGSMPMPAVAGVGAVSNGRTGSVHVTVENRPLLSLGDRYEAHEVLKPMLRDLLRELGVETQ